MITNPKKLCSWEIWRDPLNSNYEELDFPGNEPKVHPDNIEFYDFSQSDTTAVKDIDDNFLDNLRKRIHSIRPLRIVNTKLGLLTVTENALAGNHFEFWTMHTNFNIDKEVAEKICKCPGVDAFMPLTRYRCRIGFPKSNLFNITEVKKNIEKVLLEEKQESIQTIQVSSGFDSEFQTKIDEKILELKEKGKYWALYVLPNGKMEILESDTRNETFNTKLKIFETSEKLAGGHVFTN